MGIPFIAINLVSVFMFKDLGISDTQIAFWTSLIMMPWTLKFLWSPFLEMYRTKKFFVLVTELLSGVLFGIVAFSLFFDYFFAISISTMAVIAFSGATHDIACDGVYPHCKVSGRHPVNRVDSFLLRNCFILLHKS